MCSTFSEVTRRFFAPASLREIASTEWRAYNDWAASMMEGDGW
jgi:hypothetical protein